MIKLLDNPIAMTFKMSNVTSANMHKSLGYFGALLWKNFLKYTNLTHIECF